MKLRLSRRSGVVLAVVAVAGFVVVSRCTGGSDGTIPPQPAADSPSASPSPSVSVNPGGDDGVTVPQDDGAADEASPSMLVRPTQPPDVRETATAFAAAWLNTYGRTAAQWRDALAERVTDDLAGQLADADPASVPVGVVGDQVAVAAEGALWNADVPVVNGTTRKPVGTLHLTVIRGHDRWLVSEIDWERAQ